MVIETGAVNSTQALASVTSSTRQPEAKAPPEKATPSISIGETFFSPVIKIDRENQTAILQFRDTETGEITKEYPSESVRVYEEAPKREEQPVKTAPATAEAEVVEIQQRAQEDVQAVKPEQGEQPAQDILV